MSAKSDIPEKERRHYEEQQEQLKTISSEIVEQYYMVAEANVGSEQC